MINFKITSTNNLRYLIRRQQRRLAQSLLFLGHTRGFVFTPNCLLFKITALKILIPDTELLSLHLSFPASPTPPIHAPHCIQLILTDMYLTVSSPVYNPSKLKPHVLSMTYSPARVDAPPSHLMPPSHSLFTVQLQLFQCLGCPLLPPSSGPSPMLFPLFSPPPASNITYYI